MERVIENSSSSSLMVCPPSACRKRTWWLELVGRARRWAAAHPDLTYTAPPSSTASARPPTDEEHRTANFLVESDPAAPAALGLS